MERTWLAVALVVAIGCGGRSREHGERPRAVSDGGSGGGISSAAGGSPEAGAPAEQCSPPEQIGIERAPGSSPPTFMLLLDASAATTETAPSNGTIWDNTFAAVHDTLAGLPDGLPLGVTAFPDFTLDPPRCTTIIRASVAPLSADTRAATDTAHSGQPTGLRGLEQGYALARTGLSAAPASEHSAIILVTTGMPNRDASCMSFDATPTSADFGPLFDAVTDARTHQIDTFVIGSLGSDGDRDLLSALAVSGGTPVEPCQDQGADSHCHFDESHTEDGAGAIAAALRDAVQAELERAGCKLPMPAAAVPRGSLVSLAIVSDQGETPIGPSSSDPSCENGWTLSRLDATDSGDEPRGVTLCPRTCFDYLADPSARIMVKCPYGTALPPI